MASNASSGGSHALESALKRETSSVERAEAMAQHRNRDLLSENSSLPATISSIQIHGAKNTRKSFLDPLFAPIIEKSKTDADFTLSTLLSEFSNAVNQLQKFDIFHDKIDFHLSRPQQFDPSSSPTDFDVALRVKEKGRILFKTGTDLGNTEGSAYVQLVGRNVFGGAETLNMNMSAGTRTRSAYTAEFSTPINSNPDLRFCLDGVASSTQKPWASHEEVIKGGGVKVDYIDTNGDKHQFGYSSSWRQITGLYAKASPSVRGDAGDSVKSSLSWLWTRDRRDNPMLPQSGYLVRTTSELAGWGSLGGDVGFSKSEMELAGAVPIPIPGVKGFSGVSIGAGFRAGMLYPLPLGYSLNGARPSRINDRFILGGPTDVRGFSLGGLGPRDGADALGGDVFAAFSTNLLVPLPRVGTESPLRMQFFLSGGRTVAMSSKHLKNKSHAAHEQGMDAGTVQGGMMKVSRDAFTGLPSMAAGFGLVYAHPVARFELNFSLPLVMRKGEEGRKGLGVGVGIQFL